MFQWLSACRIQALRTFKDLPIQRKQLVSLFSSEVISVIGLVGVGTYLIVSGGRQQLVQQARSELAVAELQYNIKINQMGFGFRGQSDNAAVIDAAQAHIDGVPLADRQMRLLQEVLQNEVQARDIEYATLVGADLRIVASANTVRTGEVFDPSNLVSEVLSTGQQIKTSEAISWAELNR